MTNEQRNQFNQGRKSAQVGGWRAAPESLKILTPEWRAWYEGFDSAMRSDQHPNLTAKGSLRKGCKVAGVQ